ncbi:YhgE/Pip domain-containing protein [Cnuibacter physcomitrellae]|uniref:YhgE/Pip domain-containing protein n=1 Tax=Cnuibacter physcomitrellae TaxID=1619308 RepID=UPI002175C242|nr:YhgE/Pip domain-containing protein [Cnuibacter physcomitrellae]MCS5498031.1 YhgE/Pip domain-containing protein [Cnuibacter physcomitrellae]
MTILHLIAAELRRLTATPMAKLALVALMSVPVLYAGLYLWGNNDPYSSLKDVPVALVVQDTGSTLDGKAINYGDEVQEQLLSDASVGWVPTDADSAASGVRDGDFDFILTIGPDFSSALTSTTTDAPKQAVVTLTTNDTNSYLASTIAGQVAEKVRASITQEVGQQAALTLLNGVADIRTNIVTASDGATQLASGTAQAASGADQLAQGAATAASGAQQLSDGLAQLRSQTSDLPSQAAQLNDGAQQIAAGNAKIADVSSQVSTATAQAAADVPVVRAQIIQQLQAAGLTQAQIDRVLGVLDPLGQDVQDGNNRVQEANAQIAQLAAGSAQLAAGTSQLAAQTPQLTAGIGQLADGAASLASGNGQLSSGATTLANGVDQVNSGASELASGLSSGLQQIPDQSTDVRNAVAQTISDPVALDTSAVTAAGSYGAGLAPFFISLAAWIGIYALFLIVKPLSKRALTAVKRPLRITAAGWLTPAVLGAVQMTAVFGIVTLALGYRVENPWAMLGFMALTSATYATIILALNILLGSVGQFLGLVLMVLQLVTAGGTFPWQTLPAPLQVLHQIFPMSHAVDGIRQLMYGGNLALATNDVVFLLCWLGGALIVSYLGARRMTRHRTLRDLRPSLIG